MTGDTDQVAEERDRTMFLVGAQPKDSDEDLSEGDDDGESVAAAMKRGKAGQADDGEDGELSDVDNDILNSMDGDDDDTDGDTKAGKDGLDEEEATYRKRFADTKLDRDEKAQQLKESMREIARLKALQSIDSNVNEEELARSIQDGIYQDILAINERDPDKSRKAAYDVVGRHIARATKTAVDLALKRVASVQEESIQETQQQEAARGRAEKMAKIVLKEEGLDPDKHFSMFQEEVDRQMAEDKDWFTAIPAEQHFVRLTARVKANIAAAQKANADHQRGAQGQVNRGSRITPRPAKEADDDKQETDTLRGAMLLSRQRNLMRGKRAFQYR